MENRWLRFADVPAGAEEKIRLAAVHEAGHAIASHVLGECLGAQLNVRTPAAPGCPVPPDTLHVGGGTQTAWSAYPSLESAIGDMAGWAAVRVVFGASDAEARVGAEDDFESVARNGADVDVAQSRAMELVAAYRGAVERVAELLERKGLLSGDEIDDAVEGV